MEQLIKIAASQLGVREIPGDEDNPLIVNYAKETGIAGISNDEISWCSTFVNWVCMKAGYAMSGEPDARSWLRVGEPATNPQPGDVVVFWRESLHSWKGHVGFFLGFNDDGSKVFSLGGNQGDAVSIKAYDTGKVLGFRRVAKVVNIDIPQPVLKLGARGDEVMKLQILLNYLGYDCGDEDGVFGNKTDNALRLLQANNMISIDGVYGNQTKGVVEDLLFG